MAARKVFVTVGSTRFDEMVLEISKRDTLDLLLEKGYEAITLQIGHGCLPKSLFQTSSACSDRQTLDKEAEYSKYLRALDDAEDITTSLSLQRGSIAVTVFRFKQSIQPYLASSQLVVSHAGAGSCLESLSLRSPLLVVINDSLMDQHQSELAEQFAAMGYLEACRPRELKQRLKEYDARSAKEYIAGDPSKFVKHLNSVFFTVK